MYDVQISILLIEWQEWTHETLSLRLTIYITEGEDLFE